MAALVATLSRAYRVFNDEWSDPRAAQLWLMDTPFPMAAIVVGYVWIVRALGPQLMRDRKPLRVERLVQVFDLAQILANLYIFCKALSLGWATTYSWKCEPVDTSWTPHALEVVSLVHFYFLVKISDLFDSLFFILRKKEGHLSFLHVYHHGGMVFGSWIATKFFPGGHATFLGLINTFVHAVMYTYYFMTSLYPEFKRNVWWKKHITQLQMAQFLIIGLHSGQLLFRNPCGYPLVTALLLVPQNVFMLVLFADFYRKAYLRKNQ